MVRNAGQRISLHFPFFMYLWHAIKAGCLDREITPCLPTNKPPALMSSPLFIIHNLLRCQGQSDSIVMVKGKSGDPELSTRTENPGTRQTKKTHKNKKKKTKLKSEGLNSNQRPPKIRRAGKRVSPVHNTKLSPCDEVFKATNSDTGDSYEGIKCESTEIF